LASFGAAGFECLIPEWSFRHVFSLGLLGPVMIAVLSASIYLIGLMYMRWVRRCHRGNGDGTRACADSDDSQRTGAVPWKARCLRSALFLLNLQFFAFITAAVTPLACDDFDVSRMMNVPYETCSVWMRTIGSIGLVGYGFGGIGLLTFMTRRCGHSEVFAQFHSSFRPGAKYWEVVLALRRVVLLVLSLTINPRSAFRVASQAAVIAVSSALHASVQPFASLQENVSEIVSLSLLLVNVVVSVSFRAAPDAGQGDIRPCSLTVLAADGTFALYCILVTARDSKLPLKIRNFLRDVHIWWRTRNSVHLEELKRGLL